MEALVSILGAIVVEAGRILCGCVYPKISSLVKFQSNFDALENDMRMLVDQKNRVKEDVESEERNGKLPSTQVKEWLREVQEIERCVNLIQAGIITNNENLCNCCLNCSLRCRHSRVVEEKLKDVKRLMSAIPAVVVAVNPPVKVVEQIPGPSIEGQMTASRNLAKILDLLENDGVRSIGIWGMGGVGKTTLLKNLNNKLESTSMAQPFSVVLWVTVSKDMDLKRIQAQIARRLNFPLIEDDVQRMAGALSERLKKEKKFLFILDDIWERIDLDDVGIPQPQIHMGSKIIITSRSQDVCREMNSDLELKVEVLSDEESWALFCRNAGEVADRENIKALAEAITRECNGLPLAIVTVGRAMRGKTMVELWKDALTTLRRSVPNIRGIEKEVFRSLKWSYDLLEGQNIKPCFLYCSLFPEDFSIEVSELTQCWVAEGLLDEHQNLEESFNRGMALVESLIASCLLEHGAQAGTVKMHDVVRDVAIWITSSEQGSESLVRSGMGLSQIAEVVTWTSLKRISFMMNEITRLPDRVMQCSEVSTLLLQDNRPLVRVPEGFLQGFQALRVLNLSGTGIRSLPLSLLQLDELRALFLRNCIYLVELPPLGGQISKLQVLDLHRTPIRELPHGTEDLSNLRQLNLSRTHKLKTIRPATISRLSGLEVLDMTFGAYKLGVQGKEEKGQATLEDLGFLQHLLAIYVQLDNIPYLPSGNSSLLQRLVRFHIVISGHNLSHFKNDLPGKQNERRITVSNMNVSIGRLEGLLSSASVLFLDRCTGMSKMFENLARNTHLGFTGLKSLIISICDSLDPMRGNAPHDVLPNLEELTLLNLEFLSISELIGQLGLRFSRLRIIKVSNCRRLTYLIPENLSQKLEKLEEIKLSSCYRLSSLFHDGIVHNAIPNLRILELENLSLFCRWQMSWPRLEQIKVKNCPLLLKLPLSTQSANMLREIRGQLKWWNRLEWDDDETKLSLQQYFQPMELHSRSSELFDSFYASDFGGADWNKQLISDERDFPDGS